MPAVQYRAALLAGCCMHLGHAALSVTLLSRTCTSTPRARSNILGGTCAGGRPRAASVARSSAGPLPPLPACRPRACAARMTAGMSHAAGWAGSSMSMSVPPAGAGAAPSGVSWPILRPPLPSGVAHSGGVAPRSAAGLLLCLPTVASSPPLAVHAPSPSCGPPCRGSVDEPVGVRMVMLSEEGEEGSASPHRKAGGRAGWRMRAGGMARAGGRDGHLEAHSLPGWRAACGRCARHAKHVWHTTQRGR